MRRGESGESLTYSRRLTGVAEDRNPSHPPHHARGVSQLGSTMGERRSNHRSLSGVAETASSHRRVVRAALAQLAEHRWGESGRA